MKVLVVTSTIPDYLCSCLWDGMQELLGEENVVDAVGCPWLHKSTTDALCSDEESHGLDHSRPAQALGAYREGIKLRDMYADGWFDLLILHSCFNREHDWQWAKGWEGRLRSGGKVAYVEGWDAAWQIEKPQMHVDAVFRKEISLNVDYPYLPHHLTFGAPSRWFLPGTENNERSYDVFFSGNPEACHPAHPFRWQMLSRVFQTKRTHRSVIATRGIGFDLYYTMLRQSKLALCPAAADDADSLRAYEAAACGAVPIFVNYPKHQRDPWFPSCFDCTTETLPEHIDEALAHDLTPRRLTMWEHAKKEHTTLARAKKVLEVLGIKV